MASVETHWFAKGGKNLVESEIGWVTGPIGLMLMQAGYVFDQSGPEVYADVSAAEAVGVGYVAGGEPITGRAVALAGNETQLLGNAVQWDASTLVARGAIIYALVGSMPLLGFCDFVTDRFTESGPFRVEWPDPWVLRMSAL